MENIKISELPVNSSPSTSAALVGVDNEETVQIPIDVIQGLPYITVTWTSPSTLLSEIINAIETAGLLLASKRTVIQVQGYGSALLLCKATKLSSGNVTVEATNLYDGKILKATNVDATTITLSSFLTSGEYEVEGESSDSSSSGFYSYNVKYEGVNMFMLIRDLKSKGYNADVSHQPMVLTLSGALGNRTFVGYIYAFANDTVYKFDLFDCSNCTKYVEEIGGDSTTTILNALNNATITEFGSSNTFPAITVATDTSTYVSSIIDALNTAGIATTEGFILNLMGYLSGTYFCKLNSYGGNTYNVNLTDLQSLATYSTTGDSTTLTISSVLSSGTGGSSSGDLSGVLRVVDITIEASTLLSEILTVIDSENIQLGTAFIMNATGMRNGAYLTNITQCGPTHYSIICTDLLYLDRYSHGYIDFYANTIVSFMDNNESITASTADIESYVNEAILGGSW